MVAIVVISVVISWWKTRDMEIKAYMRNGMTRPEAVQAMQDLENSKRAGGRGTVTLIILYVSNINEWISIYAGVLFACSWDCYHGQR